MSSLATDTRPPVPFLRRIPIPFFAPFPVSFSTSFRLPFGLGKYDDALLMLATAMASFFVGVLPRPEFVVRPVLAGIITCNGKIAKPLLSFSVSQSCKNSLVIVRGPVAASVGNVHCLHAISPARSKLHFREHRLSSAELPLFCQLGRTL